MKTRRSSVWSYALAGALAGCGAPQTADVGDAEQAIATEHAGGVAEAAPRWYTDPDLTLASYAIPDVGGCTGEMIGPNMMMTAAHCGDNDRTITFYGYKNQDPAQLTQESFSCHILLNTFYHTDMTLHFCDPNTAGENPGDKYGYLDLDHSQPTVGEAVYSWWFNPIVSLGLGWAQIYSKGQVTATNVAVWGHSTDPSDTGPMNLDIGIGTDLWTQPGASGSPILNASNYRILVAPTSTGVSDGAGRWAQSIKTDLEQGSVDGWVDGTTKLRNTGVHDANLAALGLAGSAYVGKLDKNKNYLFDVQEDAEKRRGENARDWYFLGFESERRNALWDVDSVWTSFDTAGKTAHINVPAPSLFGGWSELVHRHLPLAASTKYRVSFMINTAAASDSNNLRVAFRQGSVEEAVKTVPTSAGAGWQMVTFDLDTKSANPELAFIVQGTLDAQLTSLSVIKDGAVMDFDTADKRYSWRNDNNGLRAMITPDGESTGGVDWAAVARPTASRAAGTDWPLRNRQLAIVPGTVYKLCLDVRQANAYNPNDVSNRVARVVSSGAEVVRVSFRPTTTWTRVCSGNFVAPTGDNNLQIGFDNPTAMQALYVDEVRLDRQPCGTAVNGCAAPLQCVSDTCVCVPKTAAAACNGNSCGTAADGCGGTVSCGICSTGMVCSAGECVSRFCVPRKCPVGSWWNPDSCSCQRGLPQ